MATTTTTSTIGVRKTGVRKTGARTTCLAGSTTKGLLSGGSDRRCLTSGACGSGTCGGDDGVGDKTQHQPGEDAPGGDHLHVGLAGNREQLDHYVENRAGGQAQKRCRHALVDEALTHQRAQKRWAAANQAEQREKCPGRSVSGERRD